MKKVCNCEIGQSVVAVLLSLPVVILLIIFLLNEAYFLLTDLHKMTFNLKKGEAITKREVFAKKSMTKNHYFCTDWWISAKRRSFVCYQPTFFCKSRLFEINCVELKLVLWKVGCIMTETCLYYGRPNHWVMQKPLWSKPNCVVILDRRWNPVNTAFNGEEEKKNHFLPSDRWWWVSSNLCFCPLSFKNRRKSRLKNWSTLRKMYLKKSQP